MEQESYSLEYILRMVRENDCESKALNAIFVDIIRNLGFSPEMLQNSSGRYLFTKEDCNFWYNILAHYTEHPYSSIRKHIFNDIDISYFEQMIAAIKRSMKLAGKSLDDVDKALVSMDQTTGYSKLVLQKKCANFLKLFSEMYISEIYSRSFLTLDDRLVLINYIMGDVLTPYAIQSFRQMQDVLDYFRDERIEEASSSALDCEPGISSRIIEADNQAYEEIKVTMPREKEHSTDTHAKKRLGDTSKEVRKAEKARKKQRTIQKKIDEEYDISYSDRHIDDSKYHKSSDKILEEALKECAPVL